MHPHPKPNPLPLDGGNALAIRGGFFALSFNLFTMTNGYVSAAKYFNALPVDIRSTLENVTGSGDAYMWFSREIPQSVWDNHDTIRVLLDGGTATVATYVGDRGIAGQNRYFETTEYSFPDNVIFHDIYRDITVVHTPPITSRWNARRSTDHVVPTT